LAVPPLADDVKALLAASSDVTKAETLVSASVYFHELQH
jgi:hypothetical protein